MSVPEGRTVYSWVTNFNPVQDQSAFLTGVESDILPLYFTSPDKDGTIKDWVFDARHTKPNLGNELVSGKPPIADAMPLGNYGVIERYFVDVTNITPEVKEITYGITGNAHVFVNYNDGTGWKTKVKVGVSSQDIENAEPWEDYEKRIHTDIFTILIQPYESKTLIIETILPNADAGGLRSSLKVNKEV